MKRNFDAKILDLKGEAVKTGVTMEALMSAIKAIFPKLPEAVQDEYNAIVTAKMMEPLTLAAASVTALMSPYEDERTLDMSARVKRMDLARKLVSGGVVDMTIDELAMIKPLLIKAFAGPLVPVVASELLEKDVPATLAAVS